MQIVLIAIGGSIGSVCRYGLGGIVHRFASPYFPFGTFVVNVLGCLVFGTIAGAAEHRFAIGPQARAFLLIGLLGGFTTFSSFTYETFELIRDDQFLRAATNLVGQTGLGLVAMWAGYIAARAI